MLTDCPLFDGGNHKTGYVLASSDATNIIPQAICFAPTQKLVQLIAVNFHYLVTRSLGSHVPFFGVPLYLQNILRIHGLYLHRSPSPKEALKSLALGSALRFKYLDMLLLLDAKTNRVPTIDAARCRRQSKYFHVR
ncbi:uncharacterized protein LOC130701328 [Daphnia carinata]|uniref:uncharacterized protein LOC130701328 n=1 Tax=Daphnia carinata TaxID=120202 RepID=UPI00257DA866|nr:uncharacterized protein LOC130701328 [Daphnia carinata]